MTCINHAEVENTAFCIQCGNPLCAQCVRQVQASVYCESCLGAKLGSAGKRERSHTLGGGSPELAFLLGLIPGVGAIYNAEYFKAAFHIVIFATLATLAERTRSAEALFGLLAFGFFVYMPFEAYFTAKKAKLAREGVFLETPFDRLHAQIGGPPDRQFWGGIALVGIGGLFLLDNFDVLDLDQVLRLWPVALIAIGVFMIQRVRKGTAE
jgi:hypothetical protein